MPTVSGLNAVSKQISMAPPGTRSAPATVLLPVVHSTAAGKSSGPAAVHARTSVSLPAVDAVPGSQAANAKVPAAASGSEHAAKVVSVSTPHGDAT